MDTNAPCQFIIFQVLVILLPQLSSREEAFVERSRYNN